MSYLFSVIFQWLAGKVPGWLEQHQYGRVAVAVIAVVLMFACIGGSAFTAATTLTRCGCSGPTRTPTPTATPMPTPTATPEPGTTPTVRPTWTPLPTRTPTLVPSPSPTSETVEGVRRLYWDTMHGISPMDLAWEWNDDGYIVAVDATGQEYATTCTDALVYVYVIDVEVRQDGEVVRAEQVVTGLEAMTAEAGTPMPNSGQYDGDQAWSIPVDGGEVWVRGRWLPNCADLPPVPVWHVTDAGLAPTDERGFVLVEVR